MFSFYFLYSLRKDEKYIFYLYASVFVKIPSFVNQYSSQNYSEYMPNYNRLIYRRGIIIKRTCWAIWLIRFSSKEAARLFVLL